MDGMDYGAELEADTFYGAFGCDVKLGDAYSSVQPFSTATALCAAP